MQRPLGAQISHMLKDRGVDVVFGIPGVHNQEMYRGIEEAGITHVLARHEQGAGFMADGYARATGKPGVAYVITGPGLTNIMTPMGQAYSDSVPMLVISSCLDETAATRGQLHQMKDQRAAAAAVCDWSEEARTAEAAYALIDRAFAEFSAYRSAPKHIQIPISLLQTSVAPPPARGLWPSVPSGRLGFSWGDAVLQAKRPLFVLGVEAGFLQLGRQRLFSRLKAACIETFSGRGMAGKSALNFGTCLGRPESADVLGRADLVVLLGTHLPETEIWREKSGIQGDCIQIGLDPARRAADATAFLWCSSDAFLECVEDRLDAVAQERVVETEWTRREVTKARKRWRAQIDSERPGLLPVIDALQEAVSENTVIYSDMTQLAYAALEVWQENHAPGGWHHPTGFGTLGYATPAAIGGAVARKGQPTMAIIGDYGFHYTMAELGVAVELGLPLPIILWDNGKLKEIEDSMTRAQIAPNAVIARNPDFCKLAEAFGARAAAPQSLSEMQDAVRTAFDADGPTLIYVTPRITSSSD